MTTSSQKQQDIHYSKFFFSGGPETPRQDFWLVNCVSGKRRNYMFMWDCVCVCVCFERGGEQDSHMTQLQDIQLETHKHDFYVQPSQQGQRYGAQKAPGRRSNTHTLNCRILYKNHFGQLDGKIRMTHSKWRFPDLPDPLLCLSRLTQCNLYNLITQTPQIIKKIN